MEIPLSHIAALPTLGKKVKVNLMDYFPREIFWDVELNELHYRRDADFIISRVLDWGDYKNAWDKLEMFYPMELIKFYCIHQAQIFGNENIEKLADKFGLKPEQFPRYVK